MKFKNIAFFDMNMTAKPDDEPAGAKKSVKRAASPAAPDVTKRAAVDAAAPVEASVGPMPV